MSNVEVIFLIYFHLKVFHSDISKPVFYVACRGHHADIGGSTPGSMPADSKTIFDEGAIFKSFFLVKRGWFNEAGKHDWMTK